MKDVSQIHSATALALEKIRFIHCEGPWADLRTRLYVLKKEYVPGPCLESNPDFCFVQPLA
jgi:hypothetical protein